MHTLERAKPPRPITLSFLLRPTSSKIADAPCPLSLELRHDGQRKRISTQRKVRPSAWDGKRQRVKVSGKQLDASQITALMQNVEAQLRDAERDAERAGSTFGLDAACKLARSVLQPRINTSKSETEFIAYWRQHAETSPDIKSNNTRITYRTCLMQIQSFDPEVRFASITLAWYRNLIDHLRYNYGEGLQDSSIGRIISKIKAVLRAAESEGIAVPQDYRQSKFKAFKAEPDTLALTTVELKAIEQAQGLTDGEQDVRKWWLIGCYTGLRISDLLALRPHHFRENGMIEIQATKTHGTCHIPIHPYVARTLPLDSVDTWPHRMAAVTFNKYIKRIARKAGLFELRSLDGNAGQPLHELITTHTARRTFATELYRQGVTLDRLMAATGHKTEQALRRYLRLDRAEKGAELAKHKFFQ